MARSVDIFADPEMKRLINEIGNEIIEAAQRNLSATRTIRGKRRNRVATGTLRENLVFKVVQTPKTIRYEFGAKGEASKYWRVIHDGRGKNKRMPPLKPIEKWIEQKKLRPRDKNGAFISIDASRKDAWRKGLAFAIAKKIGKEGFDAVPYYREAIEVVMEDRRDELKALTNKIIRNELSKILKK